MSKNPYFLIDDKILAKMEYVQNHHHDQFIKVFDSYYPFELRQKWFDHHIFEDDLFYIYARDYGDKYANNHLIKDFDENLAITVINENAYSKIQ